MHPGAVPPGEPVRSKHFVTEFVHLSAGAEVRPEPQACQLWIVVEGAGTVGGQTFRQGEVWLLPEGGACAISAHTAARFLRTYVPR